MEHIQCSVMQYNEQEVQENHCPLTVQSLPEMNKKHRLWLNIDGLHDGELIAECAKHYGLHQLTTEDILNTSQRPKFEVFDEHLFLVLKMFQYQEKEQRFTSEQLSLVLSKHGLITFQEEPGDVFDSVRDRLRKGSGRLRTTSTDYLFFALADAVVDSYYDTLSWLGNQIESLEEMILDDPAPSVISRITELRRELHYLRKSVKPALEALFQLSRLEHSLLNKDTYPYLRDLYDHICQISESIDSYRDLLKDQMDLCNSLINNRMNNIMKTLTIFSAVFIPITFVAGVYGTNFEFLPELQYKYSYFIFLVAELLIAGVLLWIFKRKKWF